MPTESQIEHKRLLNLSLPYRSFDSPTSVDAMWQDGRNCYSNSRGYVERRPGFGAAVEPVPTTFGRIQRIFTWQRWPGTTNAGYYVMVSSLEAGVATVWKFKVGSENSAVKIWTSTSAEPFDFLEANNHCFFGNGTDMRKYDGANVWQWGIDKPTAASTVVASDTTVQAGEVLRPTMSLNGWSKTQHEGYYEGVGWGLNQESTGPSDNGATMPYYSTGSAVDTDEATFAYSIVQHSHQYTGCIWSFAAFSGALKDTVLSVLSEVPANGQVFSGTPSVIGASGAVSTPANPSLIITQSAASMWYTLDGGKSWKNIYIGKTMSKRWHQIAIPDGQDMAQVQVMAFINAHDDMAQFVYDIKVTATTTVPVYGFKYRYTYGNSRTKHESSCSPLSALTVSNQVGLVASADAQVDEIHVYRTTLNGSTSPSKMQELPDSPFPNTAQTLTDTADDTQLALSYCPGEYSNDPPLPSQGFIWAQHRVWSFAGSTVYYSGYEEIIKGAFEECFPGGSDGNFRRYKSAVHSLAPMPNGAAIFTGLTIYGVEGDTLDTFRWGTLLEKRGTKQHATTKAIGSTLLWFDTSKQLWNSEQGEIGKDIRPDLKPIHTATADVALHIADEHHWLVLLDAMDPEDFPASVAVSVFPPTATLLAGAQQQFTATVTGNANTAVTWTSTGGTRSVVGNVVTWTAPGTAGTYTVRATSVADPTKYAEATVTVYLVVPPPVVAITVSPTTATMVASGTQVVTASVTGNPDTSVTWASSGGTLTPSGNSASFTAAVAGSYTVTATSVADGTKTATCTVTVTSASISVIVDPSYSSATPGRVVDLTATVTGGSGGVTWSLAAGILSGTLIALTSTSASFAASSVGTYTITATSVDDPSVFATAVVDVTRYFAMVTL